MNKQEFLERFKKELEILNETGIDSKAIEIVKYQIFRYYECQLPEDFNLENPDETFNGLSDRILSSFKTNEKYQDISPNPHIQEEISKINSFHNSGSI
jgi:hypothetical protein